MDAEPEPEGHAFFVPVSATSCGTLALRTGRLASGERIGLAFSSEDSLRAVLGPWQQWTYLSERALHGMLAPIGVQQMRVDPRPARAGAYGTPEGSDRDGAQASGPAGPAAGGTGRGYRPAA
jgi:hypothetical protein